MRSNSPDTIRPLDRTHVSGLKAWSFFALLIIAVLIHAPVGAKSHKGKIAVDEIPEHFKPGEKIRKGIKHKGKVIKRLQRRLRFIGASGESQGSVDLLQTREEKPSPLKPPYDRMVREVHQKAKVCESAEYAGVIETVVATAGAPESEGPVLESSQTFRYYDSSGNLLWRKENVGNQFSVSADGMFVGLVKHAARNLEDMRENREVQHSWGVVYDRSGNEIFKYDPGPGKTASYVGLSSSGRFGFVGRVCFETKTGKTHAIPYAGSGFTMIDDSGRCRILKYERDRDEKGKQKTKTLYEHQL